MRRALLAAALLWQGCAGIPPGQEGFLSCDMLAAGDFEDRLAPSGLRQEDVNRAVRVALDAATFTTDLDLHDTTTNCRRLVGYRVYTMPTENFQHVQTKTQVSGYTVCAWKHIVVGTPHTGTKPGEWRDSALVHEIFHAMQECTATPPEDEGVPAPFHDN